MQFLAATQRRRVERVERVCDVSLFGIQAGQILVWTVADAVHQTEKDLPWAVHTWLPSDATRVRPAKTVSILRLDAAARKHSHRHPPDVDDVGIGHNR
jgi:hypothetical protein